MKKLIVDIFTTTGISLVILAIIARLIPADIPFFGTVMPVLLANIVIHLGLRLTNKFESEYLLLEGLIDVAYITTVLIIFGWIFHWFKMTPPWALAIMAVFIYIVSVLLKTVRVREDIKEINELIEKRNKHQAK